MTIYLVDVREHTHVCPADGQPHPYRTVRTVVAVEEGGPCLAPVTIRLAGTPAVLACRRRLPHARQCDNCRPIVEIRHTTVTHDGPLRVVDGPAHVGPAHPCRACGTPVAACLDRHPLCPPTASSSYRRAA